MENFLFREITEKKIQIYNQQKHLTKKTLKSESNDGHGGIEGELEERQAVRSNRLNRLDLNELLARVKPITPGISLVDVNKPIDHLSRVLESIVQHHRRGHPVDGEATGNQSDDFVYYDDYEERMYDPFMAARIAVSDAQEAQEKQRLIKYDQLWAAAEESFVQYKKGEVR